MEVMVDINPEVIVVTLPNIPVVREREAADTEILIR